MKNYPLSKSKSIIDYYYKLSNSPFAYSTYTGMCLFEYKQFTCICKIEDNLFCVCCIDSEYFIDVAYLINLNGKNIDKLIKFMKNNNVKFIDYLTDYEAKELENYFKIVENDEWMFEVIIPKERFLRFEELPRHKRLAEKFLNNNNCSFMLYDKLYITELQEFVDILQQDKNTTFSEYEKFGMELISSNFDKLNLIGFLVFVNNKLVGYSFGEVLNNKTFVIYFLRCNKYYIGLCQALQHFIANNKIISNIEKINYTNLTPSHSLAKYKKNLKPIQMLKSYKAYLEV